MKGKPKRGAAAEGKSAWSGAEAGRFRRRVKGWFRRNARVLPWRGSRDGYAVLVSEMMCQQTTVGTVIPYYERWMGRFPDAAALAAASEREVMGLWQGLGYYARARNLHAAAKAVAAGEFPRSVEELRRLPGVGRYTAGAVAAFAYDAPAALVDANIARVLARVFRVLEPVDGKGLERIWEIAEGLQGRGGREFNGGLMELGALVCTPRGPRCGECPVREWCRAAAEGRQEELPVKKARRRTARLEERCGLWMKDGRVLLEYQEGKRWGGLWKLPALKRVPAGAPEAVIRYPFTHHVVTLSVYRVSRTKPEMKEGREWHEVEELRELPMAAGHRRALERLLQEGRANAVCGGEGARVMLRPLSL